MINDHFLKANYALFIETKTRPFFKLVITNKRKGVIKMTKKQELHESLILFDQGAFDDNLPNEKRKFILNLLELIPGEFLVGFISALTGGNQEEFVDQLVLAVLLRSKEMQGQLFTTDLKL